MKILFCQTQFKMGGQQKVLLTIAKKLAEKHSVTIYYENHSVFDFGKLNIKKAKLHIQIANFVKIVCYNLFKLNFNKKVVTDKWHLKNLKSTLDGSEYDLVILLNPYILFVDEVRNNIVKCNKIVCWTHNLYDNYVDSCFKYEKKLLFSSMKSADQIVSLERYTASEWSKINPNTCIIHNPCTIESDSNKSNLHDKVVCFVGRLQFDSKGLDYLCEVARNLDSGIVIRVAGSGSKKDERLLKDCISKYGVENRILLCGMLKGESLKNHFREASVFLMTSRYEGFPLVAIEAMSFGLPFIGFDIPSLREVTNDGAFGKLIPFGNSKMMAEFINMLLCDNNMQQLLDYSKKSLLRSKDFDIERIISEWEDKVLI